MNTMPSTQAHIERLAAEHGVSEQLRVTEDSAGRPILDIDTPQASARVSLYGAHMLSFCPRGSEHDLLFLSDQAVYRDGKAIRGGIPVCWPWFGPAPASQPGAAAHGFARTSMWSLLGVQAGNDEGIPLRLQLGLDDDAASRRVWPHRFQLRLVIEIGTALGLSLTTTNCGDAPFTISQALHSYFAVGDINRVQLNGLDGRDYLDKTAAATDGTQHGPLSIAGEVDRVYQAAPSRLRLHDAALGRRIHIDGHGSQTTVVWNPWSTLAAAMADLGDADYQHMLCIESANIGADSVQLAPGDSHCLAASYRIEAK